MNNNVSKRFITVNLQTKNEYYAKTEEVGPATVKKEKDKLLLQVF